MMKKNGYTRSLIKLLKHHKIVTLEQLTCALNTTSRMTVFRALKSVGYQTSYSHGGRYYTLNHIPQFDDQGLWCYQDIWFSKYGTLSATTEKFITRSDGGYFTRELDRILHANTKKTLQRLVLREKLYREKVMGWYLYCAADAVKRKEQLQARQILETEMVLEHGLKQPRVSTEELKGAIILFYGSLNEKERRLFAGLESMKFGYGGDRKVADLLRIDVHTVSKARKELLEGDIEYGRVRKQGGGRKTVKKNTLGS